MFARRTAAVTVVAALLVTTAGCGFILGNDSLSFAASPAPVSDAALGDTGYEETNVSENTVEREFSAADQTRTVEVTNQVAKYERNVDLPVLGSKRAAVFVTFSSPSVSVLDREFNPIDDMTRAELLSKFESAYSGLEVGDRMGERNATLLGTETTVTRHEGSARLSGQDVPVYVHLSGVVRHGDDYVVAIAIYPQELSGEREHVFRLIEGVEHSESSE